MTNKRANENRFILYNADYKCASAFLLRIKRTRVVVFLIGAITGIVDYNKSPLLKVLFGYEETAHETVGLERSADEARTKIIINFNLVVVIYLLVVRLSTFSSNVSFERGGLLGE